MEYQIVYIILAIAMVFFVNFSTAVAMEENIEIELPESGKIITFSDSAGLRTSGGLDPPAGAASRGVYDAQAANRFEIGESGILIDFNRRRADDPIIGFSPASPFDRSLPVRAAQTRPSMEVYEMPESGHLVVFPRQVELRREQAARMRPLDRVVSDKR